MSAVLSSPHAAKITSLFMMDVFSSLFFFYSARYKLQGYLRVQS